MTKTMTQFSEEYTFSDREYQLAENVVVITGVTRSGTSILGKLISTLTHVEYEYESWLFYLLPIIASAGLMNKDFVKDVLRKHSNELLIRTLLGRNVNMRETDDSCILNYISEEELKYRWNHLFERKDVIEYARKNRSSIAMKMPNFQPFYELLYGSFPRCKIIHIVRNGLDSALSMMKKGWYSDERLSSPEDNALHKMVWEEGSKEKYLIDTYIPAEDAKRFHESSVFARSLLLWCTVMEKSDKEKQRLSLSSKEYLEITFEDLLGNPNDVMARISNFIDAKPSVFTEKILQTLQTQKLTKKTVYPLDEIDDSLRSRVKTLLERHHYDASVLK